MNAERVGIGTEASALLSDRICMLFAGEVGVRGLQASLIPNALICGVASMLLE